MRKENLTEVFDAILCISELHNLYQEYGNDGSYWISKYIKVSCKVPLKRKESLLNIELFADNITILRFDRSCISDRIDLRSFKDVRIALNMIHRLIGKTCKHCIMGV